MINSELPKYDHPKLSAGSRGAISKRSGYLRAMGIDPFYYLEDDFRVLGSEWFESSPIEAGETPRANETTLAEVNKNPPASFSGWSINAIDRSFNPPLEWVGVAKIILNNNYTKAQKSKKRKEKAKKRDPLREYEAKIRQQNEQEVRQNRADNVREYWTEERIRYAENHKERIERHSRTQFDPAEYQRRFLRLRKERDEKFKELKEKEEKYKAIAKNNYINRKQLIKDRIEKHARINAKIKSRRPKADQKVVRKGQHQFSDEWWERWGEDA